MPRCPSRHPPPQIRSYTPPKPYSLPPTFALPLPPTSPQRVARGARTSSSIPENPAAVLKTRLCLRLDEHLGLGARRANTAGANGSYGTRRAVSNIKHATNGVAESDFDELLGWEKELRSPALSVSPLATFGRSFNQLTRTTSSIRQRKYLLISPCWPHVRGREV
ncbi:hypothetical protein B0H14DRAFT_2809301 [Mycena olivaceomarginata]|nr:hypothetical protein B0H14DRAFT_2809301 [Mycena olivaceomarginata]